MINTIRKIVLILAWRELNRITGFDDTELSKLYDDLKAYIEEN